MNGNTLLYCALAAAAGAGCTHQVEQAPVVKEIAVEQPKPDAPRWVSEDCQANSSHYFFIGFGEGENASAAMRNALLSSRQHALACLFGGKITSTVNVTESRTATDFNSKAEFKLDYTHVNWSGYEIVPGKVYYPNKNQNKVYAQYRWSISAIDKERPRIEKISETVDRTNALKEEVKIKSAMINEQKQKIEALNQQELALKSLKTEADQAVARLTKLREVREEKSKDISKVIANLYCGITVGQFIEIFREPDREEVYATSSYRYVSGTRLYWDQFVIEVPYDSTNSPLRELPEVGEHDQFILRKARFYIIKYIKRDFGQTDRRIEICKD